MVIITIRRERTMITMTYKEAKKVKINDRLEKKFSVFDICALYCATSGRVTQIEDDGKIINFTLWDGRSTETFTHRQIEKKL